MSMRMREYHRHGSEVTCEFIFPLSADDTYMESLLEKDKRDLAKELLMLRESSKDALEKSWNEEQNLEHLSANNVEVINRLRAQLIEARSEQTEWQLRCIEAERKQAMRSGSSISTGRQLSEYPQETMETSPLDDDLKEKHKKAPTTFREKIRSSLSNTNLSSMSREPTRRLTVPFSSTIRFWPTKGISGVKEGCTKMQSSSDHFMLMSKMYDDTSEGSKDFLVGTSVQSMRTIHSENALCINGNVKTKEDLSLIISSRDQIIANLEQTLNQNMESMHNLQAEMQRLMESQRTKEEQLRTMHKDEEGDQNREIESLRKLLKEKEEITKEKYKSLTEHKLYIQELTDELEKVLKIVNKAEKCGFI